MFKITMYSTGCPRCNILAKSLQGLGCIYSIVQDEQSVLNFANAHNLDTVPILQLVDEETNEEKVMDFSEAMAWVSR